MRVVWILPICALAACAETRPPAGASETPGAENAVALVRPQARPVDATARPVAAVAPTGGAQTTVAALGDPARPGVWIETPLARIEGAGAVSVNGQTVAVTVIPVDGPASGGSRLSLAAMQALGVPLTDLVTVSVRVPG